MTIVGNVLPTFANDLINIFKYETIAGYALLLLLAFGLNIWWLFTGDVQGLVLGEGTPIFEAIQGLWQQFNPIVQYIVFSLLISLQAVVINNIGNRYELVGRRSLLVGFFYLLLLVWCFADPILSPIFVALFPTILAIDKIYASLLADRPVDVFDIGFLMASAALIYPPIVFLFLFVLFLFVRTRPFQWRFWILLIMGTALPVFFLWLYWWLFSQTPSTDFFNQFLPMLVLPDINLFKDPRWIFKMATLLIFGIGIGLWSQKIAEMELRQKRLLRWLIGLFFMAVVLLLGVAGHTTQSWIFIWVLPLSLLIGIVSFYTSKKNILTLVSIVFIGLILMFQYL